MRVLLVSPLPPPMGGIATLTERMLDKMPSSEIQIECVNVAHKVNKNNNRITKYSKFEPAIILLRSTLSVFWKCLTKHCDIIHINSSSGGGTLRDYVIQRIAKTFKIPVVLHYHCNLEDAVRNSGIANKYLKKSLGMASEIIVLNKSSQVFVKNNGYSAIVVPNGIPEKSVSEGHDIKETVHKVAFTGRVSKAKGCLELYSCAKANPQVDFYLAGLIDEELGEKLGSLGNIKLLGSLPHNEVIDLLDSSDVFMFPTYTEGFSVSLLEAMARGVPCITTNVGANLDMIENKGGIVVESKNAEALKTAMNEILPSNVRDKMSEWNLKKVRAEYTEEKMINTFMSIYKKIKCNA